jgi:hypothetical protein
MLVQFQQCPLSFIRTYNPVFDQTVGTSEQSKLSPLLVGQTQSKLGCISLFSFRKQWNHLPERKKLVTQWFVCLSVIAWQWHYRVFLRRKFRKEHFWFSPKKNLLRNFKKNSKKFPRKTKSGQNQKCSTLNFLRKNTLSCYYPVTTDRNTNRWVTNFLKRIGLGALGKLKNGQIMTNFGRWWPRSGSVLEELLPDLGPYKKENGFPSGEEM